MALMGDSRSATLLYDFTCQVAGLGVGSQYLLYRFQMLLLALQLLLLR